jgi:nucleoside-diphosphate-sugar epimerase
VKVGAAQAYLERDEGWAEATRGCALVQHNLVRQMLSGAVPALPPVHDAMVDVRDLSALQVRAMEVPGAGGLRLIASHEQAVTFAEIAGSLREALGPQAARVPRRTPPLWLAKLLACARSLLAGGALGNRAAR